VRACRACKPVAVPSLPADCARLPTACGRTLTECGTLDVRVGAAECTAINRSTRTACTWEVDAQAAGPNLISLIDLPSSQQTLSTALVHACPPGRVHDSGPWMHAYPLT